MQLFKTVSLLTRKFKKYVPILFGPITLWEITNPVVPESAGGDPCPKKLLAV
jgi:hypothetical protein